MIKIRKERMRVPNDNKFRRYVMIDNKLMNEGTE